MNAPGLRRAVAVVAVVAAVLGLSGCFKASQDIEIKSDGTGSVTLHLEVNKRAIEAVARSFGGAGGLGGAPLDEPFKPVDRTFPDGTKVRAVNTPDRSTVDASFDFNGPDDYTRRLRQVGEAVATDPDDPLSSDEAITVRRVEDRMEVSLDLGSTTQGMEDVDLSTLNGVIDPAALPSAVVAITMPGAILSTNGQARGRTATWDLLSKTAPPTLTVTSKVDEPGLPAWALPAAAGLLLLLLLGVLAVLLGQRRRARTAGPVVPYQPGPWPPTAQAPGEGTFFPPPPGLPPREPVGWQPPPPPGGASSWLQSQQGPAAPPRPSGEASPGGSATSLPPPPSEPAAPPDPGSTWHAPPTPPPDQRPSGPVAWPPSPETPGGPSGLPTREPVGSSPPQPAGAGSPWAPAPPEPPEPAVVEHDQGAGPNEGETLPWRVPGAEADPVPPPPPEPPSPAPSVPLPVPGWYADPAGGSGARYWDGRQWTEHTR